MATPRLLVRRPSPRLQDGELTHLERQSVDAGAALAGWTAYVEAFETRGWEVHQVDPADEHPDGVFVEDTVVVFGDVAVLTSPGAATRRGEVSTMEAALRDLGVTVHRIEQPGTLEGGDVLKVGTTVYVGRSDRTDMDGIAQVARIVEPLGYRVVVVPVTKVLHLKSALTALPDGTVIGYEPLVDDPTLFPDFLAVPEETGCAVVVLDDTTVLLSENAPRTAELLRDRGLTVVTAPVGEFEKLEGCVTCLSVRVR
ncbi:dimethylargininase [Actinotalea sp. K2]|uniref:dimethylargininase n=1 Tax=Actinotalea sp. K2 TaxID=2939438 RepID=UPI002016DA91|nr:dimethylargininase [Actinotalea sp. K2]MCL3859722.1 arginine deiminase family protein [Actinotalea sp. K2]